MKFCLPLEYPEIFISHTLLHRPASKVSKLNLELFLASNILLSGVEEIFRKKQNSDTPVLWINQCPSVLHR